MNAAGIGLAQPVIHALGLKGIGAVSLPVATAQSLAGFWSLFQGLLDHNGTAAPQGEAEVPAKQSGATPPPKKAGEKTASPTDSGLPPPLIDPITAAGSVAPGAGAETPVIHTGEIPSGGSGGQDPSTSPLGAAQGASAPTQTQALAFRNTPSGTSTAESSPPTAGNIAFALQLSWQASATKPDSNIPDATRSGATQPGPKNPGDVAGQTAHPAGLNEGTFPWGAAGGEKQTVLPAPDRAPGEPHSSQGNFPLPSSSSALFPSIPAPFPAADAMSAHESELRTPETLGRIGDWRVAVPLNRGLSSQGASNADEIDAQSQSWIEDAASVVGRPAGSPASRESREMSTPKPLTQLEAFTLPCPGQQSPSQQESQAPEPAKAPRSPLKPLASIAATQGTAPNESGNMPDRDMADPESDRKASKIPVTEKAPEIQANSQSSSQGAAGIWLDKSGQPSGAGQAQAKTSAPQPQHSPSASPESQTASAVPAQPIREISLRLAGDSANVEVQVAQRAGKVQVAVRTTDQDLAKSLQTNLGELVGRLEDKGFRTEAWTPVAAQHETAAVRESSTSADSHGQPNDSGSWGGQQDRRQGQQESNQRQQGRWQTQLEDMLSAPIASAQEEDKLWYPR